LLESFINSERGKSRQLGNGRLPSGGRVLFVASCLLAVEESTDESNWEDGREFLNKVIEDNVITYKDDKNTWSYGYYLNNARFRLTRLFLELDQEERTDMLRKKMQLVERYLTATEASSRDEWQVAFDTLHLMTDIFARRVGFDKS
jgi:hypothetical protein